MRVRGRSLRVTQRRHNSPRSETGLANANDVTHQKRAEDFGRVWKSQLVELRTRHRTRRIDFRGSQRPDEFARHGRRTRWGGRWQSQNIKNVYLSPSVEEPLKVPYLNWEVVTCFSNFEILMFYLYGQGCPRGVMVKVMNCGIVVREFVLQSRYYVHFRANTLGKGMNPLILPPAMGK